MDLLLNGIGIGWTYILLSGLSTLLLPIIYGARMVGPRCRMKRRQRQGESVQPVVQEKLDIVEIEGKLDD